MARIKPKPRTPSALLSGWIGGWASSLRLPLRGVGPGPEPRESSPSQEQWIASTTQRPISTTQHGHHIKHGHDSACGTCGGWLNNIEMRDWNGPKKSRKRAQNKPKSRRTYRRAGAAPRRIGPTGCRWSGPDGGGLGTPSLHHHCTIIAPSLHHHCKHRSASNCSQYVRTGA